MKYPGDTQESEDILLYGYNSMYYSILLMSWKLIKLKFYVCDCSLYSLKILFHSDC